MSHLEEPWQAPAARPYGVFPLARRRQAPEPAAVLDPAQAATPRWYRPAFLVMLAAVRPLSVRWSAPGRCCCGGTGGSTPRSPARCSR